MEFEADGGGCECHVQQRSRGGQQVGPASLCDLDAFRGVFYDCLNLRADALFELAEAVLCAEGPVSTLVGLSLAAEHRRGHGRRLYRLGGIKPQESLSHAWSYML